MADNPFTKYRSSRPVLASPTDPTAAAEEARRRQDQEFEAQRIANEAARLRIAQQQAALQQQLGQMEVQQTQQEVGQQAQEREEITEARTVSDIRRNLQNDNLLNEINRARGLIGTFSTGNTFGSEFFQGVPVLGQGSTDLSGPLDTIKANLSFDRLQEMRTDPANKTGGALGSVTENELRLLGSAVSSLNQEMSEEELRRSLATIERHYRNVQALFNGEDPREPEVAEKYGIIFEGGDESGAEPPSGGELTSEGRWEGTDPALRGVNASVRSMIERGRSADEIRDYLNTVQPGLGDRTQDLDRAVNAVRQNPGQEVNINLERQWVPNSGLMQTMGDFGMGNTIFGGAGPALLGAADTASLGFLDNLTSNPDMTRAVMGGVSEENPTSYLLGQIVGGAGSGIGLEAALARGGLTGIAGARTADALFGAGYGAGMADEPGDSRVASALLGAGSGVVGGMAGRGLARGAGRALTGVQDAAQQTLNRAGVSMTPGQILGGAVKRNEDRLAGLPLVGDAITARRQEGLQDFNRAAFNEALSPIGGSAPQNLGGAGIEAARQARSDAYSNALSGVNVQADQQFENEIAALLARSGNLPESMADISRRSLESRIGEPMGVAGELSGEGFQQALRGLRRDARSVESQPFGYDVAQINRGAEGALEGMVQRQAPGVVDALQDANRANMNVETLRAAVNAARNQGETFTPAQLSSQAAVTSRRFGNNQGTTQQPFYELTRAGQEVLPSQIPDSGTAGRSIIPYLLLSGAGGGAGYAASEGDTAERAGTGAGAAAGTAAIAALLASAPYSQTARNTLQRILLSERPQAVSRAGERLTDMSDIAGALAAPVAVGYTGQ